MQTVASGISSEGRHEFHELTRIQERGLSQFVLIREIRVYPFLFHFKSLELNIPHGEELLAREIGTGILLVV